MVNKGKVLAVGTDKVVVQHYFLVIPTYCDEAVNKTGKELKIGQWVYVSVHHEFWTDEIIGIVEEP